VNASWILKAPPRTRRPRALSDVRPLLERLVASFGSNNLARLIGVGSGTIANWRARRRTIGPDHVQRLLDLHDVMTRALQVMDPAVIPDWFEGNEPFLHYARPIDVLALQGSGPLVAALRSIAAQASA
jgi:uncharacterized protein (DUF2384 family)